MRLKGKFRCVGVSDTGRVREHNEDTIGTDGDIGLVVLADGMGGYKAGEVASGIAVRTVLTLIKDAVDREDLSLHDDDNGLSRPGILLRDAIQRANKIIYQTAKTQANCEGMGTTVVAGLFFDDKLTIAHVGDSRLYRCRDGKLEQVTQDHSLLQELVSARLLHARGGPARGRQELRDARPRRRADRRRRDHRGAGAEGRRLPALLGRPVRHGRGRRHSVNDQHLWC